MADRTGKTAEYFAKNRLAYSPELDGIRALAALAVVCFHAHVPGFHAGFLGVDVFFVLSGYLITQLLRNELDSTGKIDLRSFYLRRLLRLYPALITLVVAYLLLAPTLFPSYKTALYIGDAVSAAFYLADYSRTLGIPISIMSHTWSVAVEEQFYLLWPPVLICVIKVSGRHSPLVLFALVALATVWRILCSTVIDDAWQVYYRLDTHASGLFFGGLLGYLRVKLRGYWGVVGLIGLAMVFWLSEWRSQQTVFYGFTGAEVFAGLLVCARPAWLGGTILAWVGRMSYGVYLWHYPITRFMRNQFADWPEMLFVGFIGGLLLAAVSHYFIERRFYVPSHRISADVSGSANSPIVNSNATCDKSPPKGSESSSHRRPSP